MALLTRSLVPLAATVAAAVAGFVTPAAASANTFGQQSIDPNLAIPVATPVRNGAFYNLTILEQIPNRRQCWQEQPQEGGPTVVDPLLLNFDFAGSCDRKTDSNGYSVRVNGADLGVQYRLEISPRQNDLVLFARPTRDRSQPAIEIGRTQGRADGFLRIQLNPGWQLTRRLYNGQPTGHIYLTHDAPLPDGVTVATGSQPPAANTPSPSLPLNPTPVPPATTPIAPPPSGSTPGGVTVPPPAQPNLPTVTVRPNPGTTPPAANRPGNPPNGTPGNAQNGQFRVIVPISSPTTLPQVRAVEPSAFRTTLNGQAVVQAGVFQDQQRADELRQRLMASRLSAQVVSGSGAPTQPNPPISSPPPNSTPIANPAPPATNASHFRVIVPISSPDTLQQVRNVEPEAFRTTVNGQNVVQVGLFQERQRAEEVQQSLVAASLPATIMAATAPAVAATPLVPSVPRGQTLVVIDPGHGGRDPGAVGIGGIQEKQINTTISNRVQQRLQEAGLTVLMTREGDQWVDLDARAQFANRAGADVFVSIHANAISMSRPEVNGLETYYLASGERLARSIHNRVLGNTDMRDRGVRQARFYVLRHTSMPAVLVETGFVTGAEDAARFRNPTAVNQIADGIARGILDYLGR
jgi:N-acetylmuramoyl-L-alanine amidase